MGEMKQERPYRTRTGLKASGVLVVIALAALLTGCGSSEPQARPAAPVARSLQLPVFEKSCARQPGASAVVPIRVVRGAIVANVCIGSKGPFPFLVDTGGGTLVDSSLAARLHLDLVDGPRAVTSFTCKRQIYFASVSQWSVGNTALLPQTIEVGGIESPAFSDLAGVLGSDTLSTFGAVRIDYSQQTLTLGPRSGLLRSDVAGGSGGVPADASLTKGTSFASPMPVKVVSKVLSPDHLRLVEVRPTVELSIGPSRLTMTLDTGAGNTTLAPSVVKQLGLAPIGLPGTAYAGLDCPIAVNHFTVGPAMLGNVQLPQQIVGSSFIPPGTVGVLGAGVLVHLSPVLVDYTDGELFLGHGEQPQPSAVTAAMPAKT